MEGLVNCLILTPQVSAGSQCVKIRKDVLRKVPFSQEVLCLRQPLASPYHIHLLSKKAEVYSVPHSVPGRLGKKLWQTLVPSVFLES